MENHFCKYNVEIKGKEKSRGERREVSEWEVN